MRIDDIDPDDVPSGPRLPRPSDGPSPPDSPRRLGIAGGYAVKAHGLVEPAGFAVQVLGADGRKGHLLVAFPMGGTYRVDVLKEPLNYPIVWMEFGPVIALADAVALKMGALHDRALPRDVLDAHGASSRFTRTELIAACRAALDDEFSLEMLRDQLAFASTYPDEAFTRYGARPELIAEVKAWALNWSTDIGLDMAEAEPWSDDDHNMDQDD